MSQHNKKDKETRQRKNVDKENSNNKQVTKTTSSSSSSSSLSSSPSSSVVASVPAAIAAANNTSLTSSSSSANNNSVSKLKKTNKNGTLPKMNAKPIMKPLSKQQKEKLKAEREALVLWRHPIKTLSYCSLEIIEIAKTLKGKLMQRKAWFGIFIIIISCIAGLFQIPGRHKHLAAYLEKNVWFAVYWTGLGILSSMGLGTGLHTFILYLGPHIARVTLAAYECNSLDFPTPPYPDDIICPEEPYRQVIPTIWSIMSKVRYEAFLWGVGTALGELPPYFMAKAARLSGYDPDDAEELAEFEALKAKKNQKNLGLMDRGKLFMERVVEKVGFFGILACASIPNPLFDLAGITCGHFLVPFWTFFGATVIGKAIIKMHIQKVFVIIAFNESLIEKAVDTLAAIPVIGKKLQEPFKGFLNNQKMRLHRQRNATPAESGNLLSKIFETFVILMICYFVVSIVNSLAQSYHKRLHKNKHSTSNTMPQHITSSSATTVAAVSHHNTTAKKSKKAARE